MTERLLSKDDQKPKARSIRPTMRQNQLMASIAREFYGFHPRLLAINLLLAPLPPFVGGGLRRIGLRSAGFDIGRGTLFYGTPTIIGSGKLSDRLRIGERCLFNIGCILDLADKITIGDRASIGHQTLIITGSHKIGSSACRCGELEMAPVEIGDGAWIGARTTILPGVTIGAGSIVGAGSVVTRDIPADSLAVGQPARVIRTLQDGLGEVAES
ncbi:MAG: DapH/DapD/GlmU-related protein [Hyphomicrobiaceae bacterium]